MNLTHGLTRSRKQPTEYRAWSNMKTRCHNLKAYNYKHYGGRGISLDPAWESFDQFYADMGLCPPGHTLERVDANLDYSKSNCIWATATDQNRNRPSYNKLTLAVANQIRQSYSGGGVTLQGLADQYNTSKQLIWQVVHLKIWV